MKKSILISIIFHITLFGISIRLSKVPKYEIKIKYNVGLVSLKNKDIRRENKSLSCFLAKDKEVPTKKSSFPTLSSKSQTKKSTTKPKKNRIEKEIIEKEKVPIPKENSDKNTNTKKLPNKKKKKEIIKNKRRDKLEEKMLKKETNIVEEKKPKENATLKKEALKIDTLRAEKNLSVSKDLAKKSQNNIESNKKNYLSKKSELSISDANILNNLNPTTLVKQNSRLKYTIISMPKEVFPKKARRLRIKNDIVINASFIIGLNGRAKDITLKSNFDGYIKYDFAKEVERAINSYKFSPIYYKNQNVEVLFHKKFIFKK